MDLDQVELTLLPAPDDPERVCYEIQAKLLGIHEKAAQTRGGYHKCRRSPGRRYPHRPIHNYPRPCRNRSYSGGRRSVGTDAVWSEDPAQIQ